MVVRGEASEWAEVASSVPQGTVLGGPLFIVYIDDIDETITSFLRKFADDTKMARVVENDQEANEFQEDICKLGRWAEKWKMSFNTSKCKIMHLGLHNKKYDYVMNGEKITKVRSLRVISNLFFAHRFISIRKDEF